MSDFDCPELPSFEPFDAEDRPPPPSIDDYPIGCEVDLVDIDPARVAQTDELWEPFMDGLFGQTRCTVRVVRHQGDYTFVVCEQDPELVIGCTLYRACLSEPKVRFKKYLPHESLDKMDMPLVKADTRKNDDSGLFEVYASSNEEEHIIELPVSNAANGANVSETVSSGKNVVKPGSAVSELPNRTPEADSKPESVVHRVPELLSDLPTRKYNYATKKAYNALVKQHFPEAVRYYTKALKYSSDNMARTLSNRSVAYLGMKNAEAAFKDAKRVIEIAPQNFIGYVRAGNTLRGLKKFEEARSYYEKALSLDTNNATLKHLLESNSIAMHFASKVEHRRAAAVTLDRHSMRVILTAKKDMRTNELAWMETSNIMTILSKPLCNENDQVSIGISPQPPVCLQCYRPLTSNEELSEVVPGLSLKFVQKMYNAPNVVHCNSQCGALYCSEACRAKAWAAHHWVECSKRGKWSEAYRQIPHILENFALERYNTPTKRRVGSGSVNHGSFSIPPIADDCVEIIIACTNLACRMFSLYVSDRQKLLNAVQLFDSMLPKESKYNACLDNHTTNLAPKIILDRILTPVFSALRQCFTTEEEQCLTFNRFFYCYERARFNSVKVRVSVWPGIQSKAESYLGLLRMQNSQSSFSSDALGSLVTSERLGKSSTDTQRAVFERIVSTPAESVPGYVECVGVFKVFAVTLQEKSRCREEEEEERCNVKLRSSIESAASVYVIVTENIMKGDRILAERVGNVLIA